MITVASLSEKVSPKSKISPFRRLCCCLAFGCVLVGSIGCKTKEISAPSGMVGTANSETGRLITPKGPANYKAAQAGFAIWLPVKNPQVKHSSEDTKWGKTDTYIFQAETDELTYLIVSRSIPSSVDTSNASEFMDGVQKGFLQTGQGQLVKSEAITLKGVAGRDILTSLRAGAMLTRLRIYFSPKFSYQVMAVGPKANMQKQKSEVDKVLDSFEVLEK